MDIDNLRAICFSTLVQLKSYFYRSPHTRARAGEGKSSGVTLKLGAPDQKIYVRKCYIDAGDMPQGKVLSCTQVYQGCPTVQISSGQHGGKIREKANVRGNSLNMLNSQWLFTIRKFSTTSASNSRDPLEDKKDSCPLNWPTR